MGVKLQLWWYAAAIGFFYSLLSSCTLGHCREDGTLIQPQSMGDKKAQEQASRKENKKLGGEDFPSFEKKIFVFKYDGSKQCEEGGSIPLKVMAKQLKGIEIYSQENKIDGFMHIQACGEDTGQANVYEIREKDLQKAQAKGFKEWTF